MESPQTLGSIGLNFVLNFESGEVYFLETFQLQQVGFHEHPPAAFRVYGTASLAIKFYIVGEISISLTEVPRTSKLFSSREHDEHI